jgi:CheY-like chemotaxis protein
MVAHGIRRMEILLVEDDEGDVVITREALDEGNVHGRLHVAGDGIEALDYLRGAGREGGGPWPDLILLVLNLPRRAGLEVLAEVKSDADLRRIPVIVLTTSDAEEDVLRSYDLHANAFVTKPVDFQRFVEVVRQIDDFFVSVARLPAGGGAQPAGG